MVAKHLFESDRKSRELGCMYGAEHQVDSVAHRGRLVFVTYFETDDAEDRGWFGCAEIAN